MTRPDKQPMTLADMVPQQQASISRIDLSEPQVLRLMVMGMVEGTPVKYSGSGFGGDPLEFEMDGVPLSLRRDIARRFQVENTVG